MRWGHSGVEILYRYVCVGFCGICLWVGRWVDEGVGEKKGGRWVQCSGKGLVGSMVGVR